MGVAGLLVAVATTHGATLPTTVTLVLPHAAPTAKVRLTFTPVSGAAGEMRTTSVAVPIHSEVTLDLPKGGVWEVRAEAEGYWAPSATVAARGASATVAVTLYPTGRLTGRLALPRGADPPESTTLWFTPAPDAGGSPPQGSTACTVAPDLAFTCPAPAGEVDLKLRARGFVSHFFWGVALPAGGEAPMGTLKLVQGGSLVGWAEPADHGVSPARCTAELQRLTSALLPSRADLERATRPLARAPLSDRGFFHLPDVAAGEYALEVSCPGYAPARLAPVRVSENAETTLSRTILLEHELALEVRVDPATDPAGRPLHLTLDERHDATPGIVGKVLELSVPRDGLLTTPPLPPGRYRVTVKGSDGTKWFNENRLLDAASGPLEITLSLVRVQGHVRAGDDPVAGTVWFGNLDGRLRVPLVSDEEGAFAGMLPHAGSWTVEVVTADGTRLRPHPVEVEEPPRGEAAEVDVELPDTRLRGRVVDDDSRPVAGADVTVASLADDRKHSLQSLAMTKSDGDGGFVFRGLAPGTVELHATDGERTSRPQHVQLPEDGEPPGVTVVLERNQLVVGHVLSPQGPVVGASVQLTPQVTGVSVTIPVSTDIHGRFEIEQPTAASLATLLVQAPGFPAVLRQVVLDPGSDLDVAVGGAGGTLAVELGDGVADPLRTMVAHDGAMAPATDLSGWARAHGVPFLAGSALNLPAMAPGDYSVCTAGAYLEPPTSGLVCATGTLPPGGELRLRLPPP